MYTIYKIKRFIWAQREFGKIMRKILNHICIAAIGVSAAFLMTACVKDYGRDDIKNIYTKSWESKISASPKSRRMSMTENFMTSSGQLRIKTIMWIFMCLMTEHGAWKALQTVWKMTIMMSIF